jgi:hypothetical protein
MRSETQIHFALLPSRVTPQHHGDGARQREAAGVVDGISSR